MCSGAIHRQGNLLAVVVIFVVMSDDDDCDVVSPTRELGTSVFFHLVSTRGLISLYPACPALGFSMGFSCDNELALEDL